MGSMKAFVRSNRIHIESEMVEENPNAPDWQDAYHYKCVLRRGRRQMTTYFSMGYAHSNEPDAESVLDCLASDAASVENARSFEDWASELGYDPDSRKAERTFNVCETQAAKLWQLLGDDAYNTLLWKTERL